MPACKSAAAAVGPISGEKGNCPAAFETPNHGTVEELTDADACQFVTAGVALSITACDVATVPSTCVKLRVVGVTEIDGPARFKVTLTTAADPVDGLTVMLPL